MNGILIIDKPEGITSHDVVARLRRILKTKKIGHTGTLDPFATGVLVMLVGKATRLARFFDKDAKGYDALVNFGYETDTGDRTGERIAHPDGYVLPPITPEDLFKAISGFMGEIAQTPPMYSAKKIDGKKLYELAREGKEVERKPVNVTIYKLQISQENLPEIPDADTWNLRFLVQCSAGTYIRTLAEDIGRELGHFAHLRELRRTSAGRFDISSAKTLDEVDEAENKAALLISMNDAMHHLPQLNLDDERSAATVNGLSTRARLDGMPDGGAIRMLDQNGELIAIGIYDAKEEIVQPKVVLGYDD